VTRWKTWTAVTAALTAAALPALAGCGGPATGTGPLAGVTLTVGVQKGGTQDMLKAAGQLGKLPYQVVFKQFSSGPPLLEAVNAGAVDIGGTGSTPLVFAAAAGSHLKVVYATQGIGSAHEVLVPKGSSLRDAAQLRGRTVALAKGSASHYHLLKVLQQAGLSISDIKPVYLQPADALNALQGGKVDAWDVWDPYLSQAEQDFGARSIVKSTPANDNTLSFQIASDKALADSRKTAALKDFVRRLARAQLWADSHKPQWTTLYAKATGLDLKVTEASSRRSTAWPVTLTDANVAGVQDVADTFVAAKVLTGPIDVDSFVDRRFNDQVAAAIAGSGVADPAASATANPK
jgi:sulfonate transport system substrate-binding protein